MLINRSDTCRRTLNLMDMRHEICIEYFLQHRPSVAHSGRGLWTARGVYTSFT